MSESPSFTIQSVRDLGPQFVQNPHGMVGQDGAFSIPLGRETLWFFGDTLIGHRTPGESLWYPGGVSVGHEDMSGRGSIQRMWNNTGLLLRAKTGRSSLQEFRYICDKEGNLRPLIPLEDNEDPDWVRVWCLHGCAVGEHVYLYYIKVQMLEEGPFPVNFEIVGSGLAVGNRKEMIFRRVLRGGGLFWKAGEPQFGSAVLGGGGVRYLYLYGVALGQDHVQRCYLARVRPGEIEDVDAYEYLSEYVSGSTPRWGKDVHAAMCLFTGAPNELSVSYNKYLGAYLAVHSLDLSGDIVAHTAPAPWGPWGEPIRLVHVPVEPDASLPYTPWVYAGKEHPELSEGRGKVIYVTYVHFEEYFPHLLEITFA